MAVRISGFAKSLVRCPEFQSATIEELDRVLEEASEPLEMDLVEPAPDSPFISSGAPFRDLIFIQEGITVPWQSPRSELSAPFLIGTHEFLMASDRWIGSYSAITEAVSVRIPRSLMQAVCVRIPAVELAMHELLMRRLARFYWVSMATNGAPTSRVAAALVSRLSLVNEDFGAERSIAVRQKDLGRLTTMSRSAVAAGLAGLSESGVIAWGSGQGARFAGEVRVPDVDLLKDEAFRDVKVRELRALQEEVQVPD